MRNKLNTAKPARGRVGICLLKYGMRNANFLNKHKKNRRTGNNFLINAIRENYTNVWKICSGSCQSALSLD